MLIDGFTIPAVVFLSVIALGAVLALGSSTLRKRHAEEEKRDEHLEGHQCILVCQADSHSVWSHLVPQYPSAVIVSEHPLLTQGEQYGQLPAHLLSRIGRAPRS